MARGGCSQHLLEKVRKRTMTDLVNEAEKEKKRKGSKLEGLCGLDTCWGSNFRKAQHTALNWCIDCIKSTVNK